jgi:hypothetical protein
MGFLAGSPLFSYGAASNILYYFPKKSSSSSIDATLPHR